MLLENPKDSGRISVFSEANKLYNGNNHEDYIYFNISSIGRELYFLTQQSSENIRKVIEEF